jgi:hypothetical protein
MKRNIILKKSLFVLLALYMLAVFPLLSQEAAADYENQSESGNLPGDSGTEHLSLSDDGLLYVIVSFEFDIKGRTRPDALIYVGEFREGEKLQGQANLEKYISEKTQVLVNQRVLKDNAAISYSVGERLENGAYPVTIIIKVEDSWNIIALPKPTYSTNTGFDLTIKARDYNFLGTMNPLRVDFGYKYDEHKRNSFMLGVFSSTPFRALGYTWNVKFDNTVSYRPDVSEPLYYQNITGLSMELPFRTTTFTFGFEESFNLNEENNDRHKEKYGNFQSGLYMTSRLFTSWEIPTGFMVSRYGELTYNPSISATFNHELPQWPLLEFRNGPFMGFSHSLGFEKIDWYANYRKGFYVSARNSYNYDFFRLSADKDPLSVSFSLNGTGHFIISKFFAISSRIMYRQWFYHDPEYNDKAADALRGIPDGAICADYMLSLNMDFPLRVLVFTPSEWFNSRKLHFFDLEFQIAPVIDMALYHDPAKEISFSPKNIAVTGGFEVIIFSAFMRNLYVRLGYVCDLRELFGVRPVKRPANESREIYLIMGHFY